MTSLHDPQPTWLREHCPSWCVRVHEEGDDESDRFHQSEPSVVPVVVSPDDAALASRELRVHVRRLVGQMSTWMAIEPLDVPQERLCLTLESARALAESIEAQLQQCAD